MRFFDLILAIALLALLLMVARREFPAYEGRTLVPSVPPAAATPSPPP